MAIIIIVQVGKNYMENLQALREEIDNMVITSPEKVKLAENIIIAIDNLSELLADFSNE